MRYLVEVIEFPSFSEWTFIAVHSMTPPVAVFISFLFGGNFLIEAPVGHATRTQDLSFLSFGGAFIEGREQLLVHPAHAISFRRGFH